MTKTLTEQMKTEHGAWYYVKTKEWGICHWLLFPDTLEFEKDITEVLAPVPSYDEYKELVRKSDKLDKIMYDSATNQGDCQQIVIDNLNREIERLQKQLNEYEQTIKALMVLLGYKNKDFNNKKEAIKARDFYIEKAKQRCKKIIYQLFVAYDCGVKEHPQKQMKKLGYKVIKAEPQTLGECWFFWVEDYIEPMPDYLVKSGV